MSKVIEKIDEQLGIGPSRMVGGKEHYQVNVGAVNAEIKNLMGLLENTWKSIADIHKFFSKTNPKGAKGLEKHRKAILALKKDLQKELRMLGMSW